MGTVLLGASQQSYFPFPWWRANGSKLVWICTIELIIPPIRSLPSPYLWYCPMMCFDAPSTWEKEVRQPKFHLMFVGLTLYFLQAQGKILDKRNHGRQSPLCFTATFFKFKLHLPQYSPSKVGVGRGGGKIDISVRKLETYLQVDKGNAKLNSWCEKGGQWSLLYEIPLERNSISLGFLSLSCLLYFFYRNLLGGGKPQSLLLFLYFLFNMWHKFYFFLFSSQL